MASKNGPVDVSAQLAALKHEKQNQQMKRLPPNTVIQRRPLHHAPVASALAASHIPKVVYVSSHTPVMAAVKRVRKFLFEIEKRATQSASDNVSVRNLTSREVIENLVEAAGRLAKANEEVLVKASGRAMQQALRVGEWFRNKEKEMVCKVEIRTGSVQAVDDIVEAEVEESCREDMRDDTKDDPTGTSTVLTGSETTMELLGEVTKCSGERFTCDDADRREEPQPLAGQETISTKRKRRPRKKRAIYDENNVPEARIRWIKTVEVAISLRT